MNNLMKKKLLKIQNLALQSAQNTFELLEEGMTEKEATQLFHQECDKLGLKKFFHFPFVWFGERTRFAGMRKPIPFLTKKDIKNFDLFSLKEGLPHFGEEFLPQEIKLEKNMPVILDVAPMIDGVFADIGLSRFFGKSKEFNKMMKFLDELKAQLPEIVMKEVYIHRIYAGIQKLLDDAGYDNCHHMYPLGVVGHKVGNYPKLPNFIPQVNINGFTPQAFIFLLSKNITAPFRYNEKTPYVAEHITQKISDGYWAFEPHIGHGSIGVKFEEILVIENGKAQWLSQMEEIIQA